MGRVSNNRGLHITQVFEDFDELQLRDEFKPTHLAGGRLDLTLTMNDSDHVVSCVNYQNSSATTGHKKLRSAFPDQMANQQYIIREKWMTRKADWRLFTSHLNNWFATYLVPDSVQQFADELTQSIHDAADASTPRQGKNKFNPNKKIFGIMMTE